MEFSRQEYWSGSPFPSPGDRPKPGIEPRSPVLQADTLPSEPPGKSCLVKVKVKSLSYVRLFARPWTVAYQALRSLSVHGIFQARVLEWVAISFSRGSSQPSDQTRVSCIVRWVLYHQAIWEAPNCILPVI